VDERRRRFAYRRLMRRMAGPRLLTAFADQYPEAFFIEIGSNDGDKHDHLRPLILSRNWRGVMVEPVPYIFARLRSNYEHLEGVALENVAIGDRDGELPFFHLREPSAAELDQLPEWYDGTGSFDRATILRHADEIPDLESRLIETRVPTLTFDTLCRRRGISRVDLLLIDTEGYDWELLKGIDLARHRPRLIIYEHFHLSPDERSACSSHLVDLGYQTMEEGFDTFCLEPRDDGLTKAWQKMRPAVAGVSAHDSRA
jgi:FkbM family methyltransferase